MAKLGPKEQGGYDPFSAIASSLTALAEEPVSEAKPSPPRAQLDREQHPQPPTQRLPAPAAHAPLTARRPIVPVEAFDDDRDDSSGGVGAMETRPAARSVSGGTALRTSKRFKTTRTEAVKQDHAAVRLGAKLGISIDFSKVTRALWEIYLRHEEDILRQVQSDGTWERPANNDAVGLAELDERLAELIGEGLMIAAMRQRTRR